MPILVYEPTIKLQRTLFFKTLPKAFAVFIEDSTKSVKVIRIVSDDLETLKEAVHELEEWKANPTYLDSNNNSLNMFIKAFFKWAETTQARTVSFADNNYFVSKSYRVLQIPFRLFSSQ